MTLFQPNVCFTAPQVALSYSTADGGISITVSIIGDCLEKMILLHKTLYTWEKPVQNLSLGLLLKNFLKAEPLRDTTSYVVT